MSEGKVTEKQYLEAVKRSRKIRSASIEFIPPGPTSPREIVIRARELRDRALKDDPFDAVWCIFDVEAKLDQAARPKLSEAIKMASDNSIFVALSNPCIELWILLHECICEAPIDSQSVQSICSTRGLVIKKHISKPEQLLSHYLDARLRAENLEKKHDREGKTGVADRNPSSGMYRLVDEIYLAFPLPTPIRLKRGKSK